MADQQAREQPLLAAVERRLARLRFDLHDGPQQDVHLLAADLQLFREQLQPRIATDPNADKLLGRLDDLAARLAALDGDIRKLATTLHSPFMQAAPLADALAGITQSFAKATAIQPEVLLEGDFSQLSDSQQIAVLALIREALSNIRKHSGARHVSVKVTSHAGGIEAQVSDDGRGFDPVQALARVDSHQHLGLVAMHERARMLGGRTSIDSRPGGPTMVSLSLPLWPPAEETGE